MQDSPCPWRGSQNRVIRPRESRLFPVIELRHLPIQAALADNIEMHFYESGHMVYAREPDLKALHANVAAFIEKTRNGTPGR